MTATSDDGRVPDAVYSLDVPHSARMYDYYLDGKDNHPADRAAAETVLTTFPQARTFALANRGFMHRSTRWLAEAGIRQFLDVGTGIPTQPNLHEIAQQVAADARVVYVDNDPLVLTHARALLVGAPEGVTAYIDADLRDPARILAEARETLDFTQPIALSLLAVLHFLPDGYEPHAVLDAFLNALPPGSYLSISHITSDFAPDEINNAVDIYNQAGIPAQARTHSEIEKFFTGLDLVDPGLVVADLWRPETARKPGTGDRDVSCYAAIARIPTPTATATATPTIPDDQNSAARLSSTPAVSTPPVDDASTPAPAEGTPRG